MDSKKNKRRPNMQITLEFLEKSEACGDAIQAWKDYRFESLDVFECIEKLKTEKKNIAKNYNNKNSLLWATWILPYCMKLDDVKKYAEFCAKLAVEAASAMAAEWAARAEAAAAAARAAARAAEWTARAAGDRASLQIIEYGIELLKESQAQAYNKKEGV